MPTMQPLRIGIYGDHLALALITCADAIRAADADPVWRNDVVFQSDQTEHFDAVVVYDASFAAPRIRAAYTGLTPPVPVFSVPHAGHARQLLSDPGFNGLTNMLGLALPTEEDLLEEAEAAAAQARMDVLIDGSAAAGKAPETSETSIDASDLPDLPKVADLAAHLATIADVEQLMAMMERDTRTTAAPIYETRFAELTAQPDAPAADTPA